MKLNLYQYLIQMLMLKRYVNTTNILPRCRKERRFELRCRQSVDRKERKKVEKYFKTNVLVSSQNRRNKKRRGRHCSGVSPTFSFSGQLRLSGRTGSVFHGNLQTFSGKAPLTTTNVPTTKRRRFLDI